MAQGSGSWRSARPFLQQVLLVPHGSSCVDLVLAVTLDRAVLLVELPDRALRRFGISSAELYRALVAARSMAALEVSISSDPRRFLPSAVFEAFDSPGSSWNSKLSASRPKFWTWLELCAYGGPTSPSALGVALERVYRETSQVALLGSQDTGYTFSAKCLHSDCGHLVPRWSLDEASLKEPRWSGLPRARIQLAASSCSSSHGLEPISLRLWRFPAQLSLEYALIMMIASISGSWQSVRSGLWSWGSFMDYSNPSSDPFDVTLERLAGFATHFQNAATLKQYLGHVRFGLRLCGRSLLVSQPQVDQLFRGLSKHRAPRELVRLDSKMVSDLVALAVADGGYSVARIFALSRCFLFRVSDELFPLQLDGRAGLSSQSEDWHSTVTVRSKKVEVTLRTRKNCPQGSVIVRRCICKDSPSPICGFCALSAQVSLHRSEGKGPRDRLFNLDSRRCLCYLRELCVRLHLPLPGWHSFRRGMATDMLKSGSSLSAIMRAGGWRSAAFLRYLSSQCLDERESLDFTLVNSDSD